MTALQILASDPGAANAPAAGSITITRTADGNLAENGGTGGIAFATEALENAGLLNGTTLETRCQSRTSWDSYTITWVINNGNLQFTYTSALNGTPADAGSDPFATRMAGGN
ncbi:MAG: hypothetical protein NC416_00475 [Eubacterium sp.]|nr:hypothetical protein [Eubacterium sp.]